MAKLIMSLQQAYQAKAGVLWLGALAVNVASTVWLSQQIEQLRDQNSYLAYNLTQQEYSHIDRHQYVRSVLSDTEDKMAKLTASVKACNQITSKIQDDLSRYYIKLEDLDRLNLK